MRFFVLCSVVILAQPLMPAGVSHAASGEPVEKIIEKTTPPLAPKEEQLSLLFAKLKTERNAVTAKFIVEQIQQQYASSGSATVDMLMENALKATEEKRFGAALDFLDKATLLAPDYAEGWNRRATLHYLMGNYGKSMSDIARVLALDPRHIGALAGLAGILEETGRDRQALEAWDTYLDYYPADRDAQKHAIDLTDKLDGKKT